MKKIFLYIFCVTILIEMSTGKKNSSHSISENPILIKTKLLENTFNCSTNNCLAEAIARCDECSKYYCSLHVQEDLHPLVNIEIINHSEKRS